MRPPPSDYTPLSLDVLAGPEERFPEDAPTGKLALDQVMDPAVQRAGEPIRVRMTDQGIIEVTLPPDQVIEGRQAYAARAAVRSLAQGRRTPVLLGITGVLGVSVEARNVYVNSVGPSAFAIVGESPVDRVIAHYLLRWKTETTPAQFFTSESDAITWLRQYARED